MSKVQILLEVAENMRTLANSVEQLVEAIAENDVNEPLETKTLKSNKPKVTYEQVRKLAVELARKGKREEIKQLISNYGVSNITSIKETDLDAFFAELSAMEAGHDTSCHCSPMQPGV